MTQHPDDATATLNQLARDRARLDARTRMPFWAPVAFAVVAALWVASPAMGDARTNYVFALVAAVLVADLARRWTGLRAKAVGPRAWALTVLWLVVTLLMYSISLGLVAGQLPLWVLVPAVVAGVTTWFCIRAADACARAGLRR